MTRSDLPSIKADEDEIDTARQRQRALFALCVTETISFGTLYYAFPIVLPTLTRDTGWHSSTALSAFSTGLLTSAAAALPTGRLLERYGPRLVMSTGSVVGGAALLWLAHVRSQPMLFAAWITIGLAQAALFYPAAFAALSRWFHGHSRTRAITALTLVAGFASLIFAPLTTALVAAVGWRATYTLFCALLFAITLPLHWLFLRPHWRSRPARPDLLEHRRQRSGVVRSRPFACTVGALTLTSFAIYGATISLIPLLTSRGLSASLAGLAFGLVGAGQVLGRLGYPTLNLRTSASTRAATITALSGLTILALAAIPGPAAVLILAAIAAGATRGAFTLIQATAVVDRWGAANYPVLNSFAVTGVTVAVAIAPAGTAFIANELGGYPEAFLVLAFVSLVASLLATRS